MPFERLRVPRPVDRIDFIARSCVGKSVLDLGAMDETGFAAKCGRGTWLHEVIAKKATRVVGVDSSASVPEGGLRTAPNAEIRRGDVMDLDGWLAANGFDPEVVVAGELIEHLPSPLAFLQALAAIHILRGRRFIFSTPNATAVHNVIVGMASRESTHHDHLCILSFKSLHTLCRRAGFAKWRIVPYRSAFIELRSRHAGTRGLAVATGERVVNGIEWMFPLLSFGYVVDAVI